MYKTFTAAGHLMKCMREARDNNAKIRTKL